MKRFSRNDEYINPPGSLTQRVSHPYDEYSNSIDISIFNDHRYAFFFWNKWTRKLAQDGNNEPPCLVTLDWHQDLVYPEDVEKDRLQELNLGSNYEVALYSWINLRTLNDTHILSAAYLNLIGNVYVHCRQGTFASDWEDEYIVDMYGNTHTIKKFEEYQHLEKTLLSSDEKKVYFDIDLDFFTIKNPLQSGSGNYSYLPEKMIKNMLDFKNPFMKWVFERLQGITIATEPEHTGGILKSNRLLNVINKIWFDPPLFTSHPGEWQRETKWKHLKKI